MATAAPACVVQAAPARSAWQVRQVRAPGHADAFASALPPRPAAEGQSASFFSVGEVGRPGPLPADVLVRAFDAAVRSGRDAFLLPGVALAVVRRDGAPFCAGYGVASLPAVGAAPVDAQTAFASAPLVRAARDANADAVAGTVAFNEATATAPTPLAWRPRDDGPSRGANASSAPAAATRATAPRGRATGHEVALRAGRVRPVAPPAAPRVAWGSACDWAESLRLTLAAPTARGANLPAAGSAANQPDVWRGDLPGFVARVAVWPARGLAWALLANAGAGPGVAALEAELLRTAAAYTPAPHG